MATIKKRNPIKKFKVLKSKNKIKAKDMIWDSRVDKNGKSFYYNIATGGFVEVNPLEGKLDKKIQKELNKLFK